MFKTIITGHLGADAEMGVHDGKNYVKFRVATSRKYTKQGQEVEETQWHSCIMSGDGGKLLEYLKKGQRVAVIGTASLGVVSSPKLRRMVAASDINVDSVELLGGNSSETMPRELADEHGCLHRVNKAYFIELGEAQVVCGDAEHSYLFGAHGERFVLTSQGWILPDESEDEQNTGKQDEQQ